MTVEPLAIYFGLVVLLVTGMIGVSYLLGERHREPQTNEPYESGVAPAGSARVRFPARFYLVAMLFVVFDLEAVFVYAWAVSARETGWSGYFEVAIFVAILLAALLYLWRTGALELAPPRHESERKD